MSGNVLSPQEKRLISNSKNLSSILSKSKRSDRIEKIYKSFCNSRSLVDINRAKYFTESFKETEGQPLILRWAKALYHIVENIPVYIDDDQLLVGRVGGEGKYGLIYPELDGCFLENFAESIRKRVESPFDIDEEDLRTIEDEIAPYWKDKSYYESLAKALPEDVLKVTYDPNNIFSSRYIVNETSSMRSALQWVHDYKKGITKGFKAIKEEAQNKLDSLDEFNPIDTIKKAPFLQSIVIVSDAIVLWAHRHSELAKKLALNEKDETRRLELLEISDICSHVPEYPARNFHEAMQSQWFLQMFSRLEQKTGATISNGRMDQYLFPFYKKDLEEGKIDRDGVKELLQCMWLGMAQYLDLYVSPAGACFNEGYAHWEAVTIGGVDENGHDATNELTYIFLEDKREFPLNYPDLAARIHSRSPERYLNEVAETIKEGSGFPKLINDEEVVPLLVSKGATFAEANDYAVSGCTEVRMPNRDTYTSPCAYINLGAAIELTLNNGRLKKYGDELLTIETGSLDKFKTWEDFWDAYVKQQTYLLKQAFKQQYIVTNLREKHFASPFGSALHDLCMKNYKDLHSAHIDGGIDLGYFDLIGFGSAADSLSAIKKHVFDEKKLTLNQIWNALDKNFEGEEVIRQILINSPCYGNADPYADDIARNIDLEAVKFANKYSKKIGIYLDLRYVPVTSHIPFGRVIGALPNGRKAGTALSDGSSASHGADVKGPTAVLLSNYNTKNPAFKNRASRLLNIKLSPATVAGSEGTQKLIAFIKSWCDLKLWHLQFNIINQETLYKAKKDPQKYRNLLVRVAGYSAYFVDLSPELQDDIILRTEHEAI
ncbi:(2S)-3-sulfopropanediol dehydratase [Clostridium sp. LBM24168]